MSHLLMFAKIADLSIKASDLTHESRNFTESDLFKNMGVVQYSSLWPSIDVKHIRRYVAIVCWICGPMKSGSKSM